MPRSPDLLLFRLLLCGIVARREIALFLAKGDR
jgi:hypothetical protein